MKTPTQKQYRAFAREITRLLISLKQDIGPDYRAHEDDETPGILVTVGARYRDGGLDWSYQTGDNSYTGGAYGYRHWGVGYLYPRSKSAEVADGIVSEIADGIAEEASRAPTNATTETTVTP